MARAPLQLDVRSNIADVVRELQVRDPKLIRRATVSGLNSGMTISRQATIKFAAGKTGVAQKYLRGRTEVFRASTNILSSRTSFLPRGLNPLKVSWNAARADAYYKGPRAPGAKAFIARMPNGSEQIVIRLPKSVNPAKKRTSEGARRKGRLPIQSIRIFIGKQMIDEFSRNLRTIGAAQFENQFRDFINKRAPSVQTMKKIT